MVEPASSGLTLGTAYPLLKAKLTALLLGLAQKPINKGVQRFRETFGVPPPELEGVMQDVIARAFLRTVTSIIGDYLEAQERKILRTQDDERTVKQLRQRLKELSKRSASDVAPQMETIDFSPVQDIEEDELQTALLTRIREYVGELPEGLEHKFSASLLPRLRYSFWLQLGEALEDPDRKKVLVAYFIQALSRIEGTVDAEQQARKIIQDQLTEISRQLTEIQVASQQASDEFNDPTPVEKLLSVQETNVSQLLYRTGDVIAGIPWQQNLVDVRLLLRTGPVPIQNIDFRVRLDEGLADKMGIADMRETKGYPCTFLAEVIPGFPAPSRDQLFGEVETDQSGLRVTSPANAVQIVSPVYRVQCAHVQRESFLSFIIAAAEIANRHPESAIAKPPKARRFPTTISMQGTFDTTRGNGNQTHQFSYTRNLPPPR